MLREVKGLYGAALRTLDGEIGGVDEILFDDALWTSRHLVVDTGGRLDGRKVLIAPAALGALDREQRLLHVNLTRRQVEASPGVETDEPVSRGWEMGYHDCSVWPYYRTGTGMMGAAWYSGAGSDPADPEPARDAGDARLHSTRDMTGYRVAARDGHLGHVADFLVDDETWMIRYLVVETRDWRPGKKVLLPLDWIGQVSCSDRTLKVEVTRDQARSGPEWDPHAPISRAFEARLAGYYTCQCLGAAGGRSERMESFTEH